MIERNEALYQEYLMNKDSVLLKETSDPDLFVLKYKRKVFFSGEWNDFLRECRGMIVDKNWNIVSLPFTKIHNYGIEASAPNFDDDERVFASRKVNGFMIAVTWYKDRLLWSTTGSIDSDFVAYAQDIYLAWPQSQRARFREIVAESPDCTFMFECVHPKDPHIVGEEPGLYFLGTRRRELGSAVMIGPSSVEEGAWHGTGVKIVETFSVKLHELKEMANKANHEGFVFESISGAHRVSKIKSPHYLTKKFLMRGNWERFIKSNKDLPEEFIDLTKHIRSHMKEEFFAMDEIKRREFIEQWFTNKEEA